MTKPRTKRASRTSSRSHRESPLRGNALVAFVATTDATRARAFYRDLLGLRLLSEDQFALLFDVDGTELRVTLVKELARAEYTVLGWRVKDIVEAAKALTAAGVSLLTYPGMEQDDLGIWTAPSRTKVAWFKDPDGNTLSISQ